MQASMPILCASTPMGTFVNSQPVGPATEAKDKPAGGQAYYVQHIAEGFEHADHLPRPTHSAHARSRPPPPQVRTRRIS